MVTARCCSVAGCKAAHQARGYCKRHYKKWAKYGDATHRRNADHGEPAKFLLTALASVTDACIFWPFSRYANGYGSVWFNGKITGSHRLMCRVAHGEPQAAGLQAAHSCGVRLCINPRHLSWKTPTANEHDKAAHGTRRFAAHLSEEI